MDSLTIWLLLAAVCVAAAVFGAVLSLSDFSQELKYLNYEIKRTEGEEQKHYRKKKRKLIFSVFRGKRNRY